MPDTPSRRAGLRDDIVTALGRIAVTPPVEHRRQQADQVLALLYREWPWLRAEAEETESAATGATERPTLRERHHAQWLALTDDERAARLAELDEYDEPEPAHPIRQYPDERREAAERDMLAVFPPTSSEWTPPPPGDRREQLPDHLLALINIPAYTSTACEMAALLTTAADERQDRADGISAWVDRLHARCRLQNKFTGAACNCPCHAEKESSP